MKDIILNNLNKKRSLQEVVDSLQFIQIDPIKSPACTQDLVLRNRVEGYKNGDINKYYSELNLEEDFLYAYGYMTRDLQALLYPRETVKLSKFDNSVFEFVSEYGHTTSRNLEKEFGKQTVRNGWGGKSRATKKSLDTLHKAGLLRVSKREKGIRVYQATKIPKTTLTPEERKQEIIKAVVNILGPVHKKTLNQSLFAVRHYLGETQKQIKELLKEDELEEINYDGEVYYQVVSNIGNQPNETHREVKFISPFDPIVWDRIRFEQTWGWPYRFEAYTPPKKRIRGYYAMPMLWRDDIIGWVNIDRSKSKLDFEFGYVTSKPKEKAFDIELEKEIERFKNFYTIILSKS